MPKMEYVYAKRVGHALAIKSRTLSKNRQNTWGLAGQPCFTPMLTSKAVDMDPPARTTNCVWKYKASMPVLISSGTSNSSASYRQRVTLGSRS